MTDESHKSTIIVAAETMVKLAQLLEMPPSQLMIVIPKPAWKEFVNRCSLDARGMAMMAPTAPKEHTPRWVKILDIYYVPGQ